MGRLLMKLGAARAKAMKRTSAATATAALPWQAVREGVDVKLLPQESHGKTAMTSSKTAWSSF